MSASDTDAGLADLREGRESLIGVDVVDIERFRAALARTPRLTHRLFTAEERAYCERRADPVVHLAGTLAAKEATIKALRLGNLMSWARRVHVSRDQDGVPSAIVVGQDDEPVNVELSIAHDGPVAVAIAVAGSGRAG